MNRTSKRILAIGLPLATVSMAGIAFAAWTATGGGDGSAQSEANQNVTFSSSTVVTKMFPTGSGSIDFTVANPNHYGVRLSAITVGNIYDIADVTKADVTTSCALTYTAPASYTGANFLVAHDATAQVVHLVGALGMGNGAANSCANKTFGVVLSATTTSE